MTHVRLKSTHGARPKITYVGVAEHPFGDLGRSAKASRLKRTLIREAEAIVRSTESASEPIDWKATNERFHRLHERWKKAGSAGEHDQRLWKRFKKAGDRYRSQRDRYFAERVSLKQRILTEARGLSAETDYEVAKGRFSDFMHRWREIGNVGELEEKLWRQLLAARKAMYEATAEDRAARRSEYVQRVEERIHEHRETISKLRAKRRELAIRRRGIMPGWVGGELAEGFDEEMERIDLQVSERERWVGEDLERIARAKADQDEWASATSTNG